MISVRLIGKTSSSLSFNRGVASLAAAFLPSGGLSRRSQTSKLRLGSEIGLSSYTSRALSSTKLALKDKSDDGRDEENRGICISRIFGAVPLMPSAAEREAWDGIQYPAEQKLPSVSTILNETMKPEKKAALLAWEKREIDKLGFDGFMAMKKKTLTDGMTLHKNMETVTESGAHAVPQSVRTSGCLKSFFSNPKCELIKPVAKPSLVIEAKVKHSKLRYGGRLDAVCRYEGEIHLIDWKSCKKPWGVNFDYYVRDYMHQVVAYLGALNCDPDKFAIPQINRVLLVICYHNEETATFRTVKGDELHHRWAEWVDRVDEYREGQVAKISPPVLKPDVGGIVGSTSVDIRKLQSYLNFAASFCNNVPQLELVINALKQRGITDWSRPEYAELAQLARSLDGF